MRITLAFKLHLERHLGAWVAEKTPETLGFCDNIDDSP